MSDALEPPPWGDFGDESFPLCVILLFRSGGGWHLSTALCRSGRKSPTYVGEWTEPWSDRGIDDDWRYLEERIVDERYGNGQTFEIVGFRAHSVGDAERIALAKAAEVAAASEGPSGEPAGTFADGGNGGIIWMPFVVVAENGAVQLVGTDATPEKPVFVIGPHGAIEWETFESVQHWQRNGERAWALIPHTEHRVWWVDGEVHLTVTEDGSVVRLAHDPAPLIEPKLVEPELLTRERRPAWTEADRQPAPEVTTSEDPQWGWAIPMVMRAAAGPAWDARWPAAPDRTDPDSAYGYWTALHHLLQYSFGWRRPDRGLRWWYDEDHPTDDRRLRLIAGTYLADGQLDWYAAWLWRWHENMRSYHQTVLHGLADAADDGIPIEVDREWLLSQESAAASSGIPDPLSGGTDPLHLSSHAGGPVENVDAPVQMRRSGRGSRSGVLVCDSAVGWYRALFEEASKLPSISDHRWRIDVVIKSIGWIGTYRRSPETGLWYVGDHRLHLRGS